jgi:hypothetical protein
MRELTAKNRKHRLRMLLMSITGRRARRAGDAAHGSRSWDH